MQKTEMKYLLGEMIEKAKRQEMEIANEKKAREQLHCRVLELERELDEKKRELETYAEAVRQYAEIKGDKP